MDKENRIIIIGDKNIILQNVKGRDIIINDIQAFRKVLIEFKKELKTEFYLKLFYEIQKIIRKEILKLKEYVIENNVSLDFDEYSLEALYNKLEDEKYKYLINIEKYLYTLHKYLSVNLAISFIKEDKKFTDILIKYSVEFVNYYKKFSFYWKELKKIKHNRDFLYTAINFKNNIKTNFKKISNLTNTQPEKAKEMLNEMMNNLKDFFKNYDVEFQKIYYEKLLLTELQNFVNELETVYEVIEVYTKY